MDAMDAKEVFRQQLCQLWLSHRQRLMGRIATLETALGSLESGLLSLAQQEEARSAAHNLAGVLGTFGLQKGTDIARQLEAAITANSIADTTDLRGQLGSLRALIETHQP
jgi:HPt (histidine-containing phosphotransfer) domain-containing protein